MAKKATIRKIKPTDTATLTSEIVYDALKRGCSPMPFYAGDYISDVSAKPVGGMAFKTVPDLGFVADDSLTGEDHPVAIAYVNISDFDRSAIVSSVLIHPDYTNTQAESRILDCVTWTLFEMGIQEVQCEIIGSDARRLDQLLITGGFTISRVGKAFSQSAMTQYTMHRHTEQAPSNFNIKCLLP